MMRNKELFKQLELYELIFWDFDGVIKESVTAKSYGFEQLFSSFGTEVVKRVCNHHEKNGGISRFKKIPLYLEWANVPVTDINIQDYCNKFSGLVKQAVIDSPWVIGVKEYLEENHKNQIFILITATPEGEIIEILKALDIDHCFLEVHGAPKHKQESIKDVLQRLGCQSEKALVIGDSDIDLQAAEINKVEFLLRNTDYNESLQKLYSGSSFYQLEGV